MAALWLMVLQSLLNRGIGGTKVELDALGGQCRGYASGR
jgi:hypothetical protein